MFLSRVLFLLDVNALCEVSLVATSCWRGRHLALFLLTYIMHSRMILAPPKVLCPSTCIAPNVFETADILCLSVLDSYKSVAPCISRPSDNPLLGRLSDV